MVPSTTAISVAITEMPIELISGRMNRLTSAEKIVS